MHKIIWTAKELLENGSTPKEVRNMYKFFGGKSGSKSVHQIGYLNADENYPIYVDFKNYA